jgi:hypothetical protein
MNRPGLIDRDQGPGAIAARFCFTAKMSRYEERAMTADEVMNSMQQGMHSRRALIRKAAYAIGGIAAALAASPAQAKMSQKVAEYQASPKDGQSCANCALYRAPASCTLIDGNVAPTGWCRFYARK